ncbi:MAG: 5'/3'-nucleotidase SurE [Candidatus Dadabacteria bacterium]|nr:MAG: 5'/3'-nucleotidase SurE [Candidatus Dadabacteria bacterium]
MLILLSNDDGIHAPGLATLARALSALGRVVVVAPDRERSAVGHALTLHRPLRLTRIRDGWFAVDGTPTDCVHLGLHGLLETAPDLVVAGINHGPNLADDITYSGTVAVALEGALMGVPSFAVSVAADSGARFGAAAEVAVRVARAVAARGLPAGTFLNVNVPSADRYDEIEGIRVTRQGKRVYGSGVVRKHDPRGREYFWIGVRELGRVVRTGDTDVEAVEEGYASITPIRTDLTDRTFLGELTRWAWDAGAEG